jgi:DNA-binding MarR family transcriptional regulator
MTDGVPGALAERLGYLFKHAHQRLLETAGPATAPFGVDGRELAVLAVLGADVALSQQEAAQQLGVDRTTMVALVDGLEQKGLVERRRSTQDRRKNTVRLSAAGQTCLRDASQARDKAEREFLAPLGEAGAARFVQALRILASTRCEAGRYPSADD